MDKIQLVRNEIERRRDDAKRYDMSGGNAPLYDDLLSFIDTLPEQPVKGLDKDRFLKVLDQWEEHAIRGMRNGATAYHQGKIALITDLRDWINREG